MPVTRWTRAAAAASSLLLALSCTETTAPGTPQPPPSLYAISPSSVPAGSGPFTLTVSGADFTAQSRVRWNDADRPTTFVSDSVLTARIGGADVTFADSASVTVYTGAPGGGTSGRLAFKVASPQTLTWTLTNVPLSAGSWDVAVSPNGLAYVTQLGGDSIDRIDVPTNTVAGSIAVGNWPYEVSFNGTGSVAYESNAVDHSIGVINTATDSQTASFGLATQPIR
ncbi:MAG TPA: hypothetical protein VFK78_00945, partial [Gemmatimonadales bacterium]|nr:hypothetical protein [Gemmatimonadales bacterium]